MKNTRLEASRLRLLSDRPDQLLFVSCFVLGLLIILFLKFFAQGTAAFLALFFAVLIIVAYAFTAFAYKGIRLPDDRIGDNCYYLGFLFTLVSLSTALYSFSKKGLDAHDLVSDFGVALGSTIAGIFVRIVIQQMRVDTEQIGQEVRRSMTELAVETSADLQNVKEEVATLSEGFKITLKRSADELEEVSNESVERLKALMGRMEEVTSGSATSLVNFKARVDDSLTGLTEAFARANANISNTSITTPSNLFAGLQSELRKIETSMSDLSLQLNSMNVEVTAARSQWLEKVANERFELPESVFSNFKTLLADLLSTVKSLNEEITILQTGRNKSQELHAQKFISVSNESIEELTRSLNRGRIEFDEFFSLISGLRESLRLGNVEAPVKWWAAQDARMRMEGGRKSRWRYILSRAFGSRND